jgi:hypothetical protein
MTSNDVSVIILTTRTHTIRYSNKMPLLYNNQKTPVNYYKLINPFFLNFDSNKYLRL